MWGDEQQLYFCNTKYEGKWNTKLGREKIFDEIVKVREIISFRKKSYFFITHHKKYELLLFSVNENWKTHVYWVLSWAKGKDTSIEF